MRSRPRRYISRSSLSGAHRVTPYWRGFGSKGSVALQEPEIEELFPGFTTGRSWSWAENPEAFTLTNYTVTTDGGEPALEVNAADSFTQAVAVTAATNIAHARVKIRFRAVPQQPLGVVNINVMPTARWQGASNQWRVERTFADGAAWLLPVERIAGSNAPGPAFGDDLALDRTTTTDQWITLDVFDDVMRAKTWFASGSEPGWKGFPCRFRPAGGFGGTPSSLDNIPMTGAAGVTAMYGGLIKDIIVEELVPVGSNIFYNTKPYLLDSLGRPLYWSYEYTVYDDEDDLGIIEVVNVEGPAGVGTVPVFRFARTNPGTNAGGPSIVQPIYLTNNDYYSRDYPIPTAGTAFPDTLHWSVWAKGTNLANSNLGNKLTARWVNYYSDANAVGLNIGYPDYHWALGPNNGMGTFDWTFLEGDLTIHENEQAVVLNPSMGLHDQEATGELLLWNPTFTLP